MKVKTKIMFEIEYPLSTEFYVPDNEGASLEMEKNLVAKNPKEMLDAFWRRATITTSVEKVADNE